MKNSLDRLQKVIAQSGVTSRRKAEQLIINGKVKVNNRLVTQLGTKVTKDDLIEVEGELLEKEKNKYFLLYKPRGVVSTLYDGKGREIVIDYLNDVEERIYPIGRLDYHTSGILLLTNDGEFANLLMHPRYEVEKVYIAKVKGIPSVNELDKLREGVKSKQDILKAIKSKIISVDHERGTATLEITLHEGKNRHIRRMLSELKFPVIKLKREKFGYLTLHGLRPGEYRPLTLKEVNEMKTMAIKNVEK